MRWDAVVVAILAEVEADALLTGLFGTAIFRASDNTGERDFAVPSMEYTIISDVETERFNPIRIQWDVFVREDQQLVDAERRLRGLFHHDLPTEIQGLWMWAQYAGRNAMPGMRDGIRASSTDFVFTPIRSRYVWTGAES